MMLVEFKKAIRYSNGVTSQRPDTSSEEGCFDLKRLSIADVLAACIRFEKGVALPVGYQPPMHSVRGYVRCDSTCNLGNSVTGYWQAPSTTGTIDFNSLDYNSMWQWLVENRVDLDFDKFDMFIDECLEAVTESKALFSENEMLMEKVGDLSRNMKEGLSVTELNMVLVAQQLGRAYEPA
jgi:hypothetical protein